MIQRADHAPEPPTWVEVDLAAYRHNLRELRRVTRPAARIMAVVKADAYGHGAVPIARAALGSGAEWLGVARLDEAIALRRAGIQAPTLIFGFTSPAEVDLLLEQRLSQAVFGRQDALALSDQAAARGASLRVHLEVDTGMGRLGLTMGGRDPASAGTAALDETVSEVLAVAGLPGLELEGLFTHFATADSADRSYADAQLDSFLELIAALRRRGLELPLTHAANSAALIDMPDSHLDMVRPGIATYGLYPSSEVSRSRVALRPVLEWKTRIVQLRRVPAGFGVSYGITYRTRRPTTLATVAVGYGDGLSRLLSSRGQMLVGGRQAAIAGRVCMDLTVLDVGDPTGLAPGAEVVILGRQGDQQATAGDMAELIGTITYEVVATISARVPRLFLGDSA